LLYVVSLVLGLDYWVCVTMHVTRGDYGWQKQTK
jgi:hypothetical protein